jgi:hypothetical protein
VRRCRNAEQGVSRLIQQRLSDVVSSNGGMQRGIVDMCCAQLVVYGAQHPI